MTEMTESGTERGSNDLDLVLRVAADLSAGPDLADSLRRTLCTLRTVIPFATGAVHIVTGETVALAADGAPGTRSCLAVPLLDRGDIVGVLQLESDQPGAFTAEQQDAVVMLTPLMGAAVGRARSRRSEAEAAEWQGELDRLRTEFIGLVSHELRTPVTVLVGFASLLAGEHADSVEAAAAIGRMEAAVERLRKLLRDLGRLAALDAGRLDVHSRPVDLMDVVNASLDAASSRPTVVTVDGEPVPSVMADPARLEDALRSLLDNAVKFSPDGSPVTVAVHHAGETVDVVVEDGGPGVPPEQAVRVFEPFAQAEALLTRRSGGLGVGLTTARSLVERMGGQLDILPGDQSRFRIRLAVASS
jgi:signal transduction histidine kinase